MPQRTLISDLSPNELVSGVYALQNCQLGLTKAGKPFLKCLLGDRSGRTPGRMWNASEQLFETLPTDGFVFIEGQTQPYQGEMQIIIQSIAPVEPMDEDLLHLLPSSEHDVDEMLDELRSILGTLEHPAIAGLVRQYLEDEAFVARFRRAPAAMTLHHAFLGGLLEHTLNLVRLADRICPCYPELNRDIVLTGLFLHDLGKCIELTWERGFGYTDEGHLVGHIAQGVLMLQERAAACAASGSPVAEPILRVLRHVILSHHGRLEHGALKIPATPEAIFISQVDNLDAKLHMAIEATRRSRGGAELGGHFTEKIWALETRLYRPDPTTMEDGEPQA